METICGLDRISGLPGDVIDRILACLPLKDAVRTSTLSNRWKEKWQTMPQIMINDQCLNESSRGKIEGIINYILTRHEGQIERFAVSADKLKDCYNFKLWMWRLSQKSVQELALRIWDGRYNEVPAALFSCEQLRVLNLHRFEVKAIHSFKGFPHLVSLRLDKINIATAVFQRLIAGCPLLEKLALRKLSCIDHLRITVPSLKQFYFDGEFKSICFDTPLLEVLSVDLYRIRSCDNNPFDLRFRFHSLPPAIKELHVRCPFQMFLAAGNTFCEISSSYSQLKTLRLESFCFEKLYEVSCLLSLIGNSANVETLDINACNCEYEGIPLPVVKFWEDQNNSLKQLQKARVRSFHGKHHETRFIQYVLANAPLLKEMTVECIHNHDFDDVELQTLLLCLCPDSVAFNFIGGNHDSVSDDSSDSS